MTPARETIYAKLFSVLQGAANFQTVSRKYTPATNLTDGQCPALFMVQVKERYHHSPTNLPPLNTLHVDVVVVVSVPTMTEPTGAETVIPASLLNPVLDGIDAALQTDNPSTNQFTLGGLVKHCYIEGEIMTDEGTMAPKAMAVVPIEILLANPSTA
jgi:hypothetical protein